MTNLVNLEKVNKSFGVRPLLDEVSLGVSSGDRIGVVGLNGGGKTTLLEVLAGLEPPDGGRVSRARDLRMAVVTQRTDLPAGSTVREAVLSAFDAEHEWAADARIRSILDGLGLTALGMDSPVDTMSGGERRRVALAAALVRELDLVVLDEPTNHLDIEGVQWLADHLLARGTALVVVTHDRWFLDTVCTKTWEVVGGRVEQYEGGYADWVYARAERARLADTLEEKRRNLARKELAWLRRGAPARTSKPRYRIEAAEALISDVPAPRDSVELLAFAKRRLGRTVLELEDVSIDAGPKPILRDVTWRIGPGDRVGLVGVNGSGKSTVLKLLAGDREPSAGKRIQGQTVRLAHLSQELHDLPPTLRVLEAVEEIARRVVLGKQEMSASQLAERFGFPAARQWTPVSDLSGGERRRLQLARLLMAEPNVLLLDEPTNDLDIDTLQQLEDLLDSWPGTLVVVSHDRYLVERVCDSVHAVLGDGKVTHLVGGIDEYLSRRATPPGQTPPTQGADPLGLQPTGEDRQNRKRHSGNDGMRAGSAEHRAAQKELARLERRLETLTERETRLNHDVAEAGTDLERLAKLDAELRQVVEEKADVETRWLELADALE
ncbi:MULTISPECIES: ABC-F family ATP-binding cassette domain-containing protein [Actinokineospora]|uniref:ABC transporter ATP-binding protein n=1 Tax=Actinokineospora fastidiosa TaxID=1816 RepID=A0A918G334_9PSEU|nr:MULTISPECIES: ABC-F family ATP-binding cassette domain-containing protein [Actinokineospora]UVS76951.1 putative ABC transporter ATP-binding protein [Actinokineospora sp. UTMC 2448]GGS14620.1 ABC transporter ATP-binding protein [Actinokineospora fastidiosa]